MLRRLKLNGAEIEDLVDIYIKQVRCTLELAVPVWSPSLTKGQSAQIERVQKSACAVIQGCLVHTQFKNISGQEKRSVSEIWH